MPQRLPQPDAPQRVCDQIVRALQGIGCVRSIAVFGSFATDTADAYSDVDMFVVCDDPARDGWAAAHAIRRAKPVLYYRMFSTAAQPAGRYWFDDESPLTRLDISFHTPQVYEQLCDSGDYFGHPLTIRPLYTCDSPSTERFVHPPRPLDIAEQEACFGERIYRINRAVKNGLRGRPFRYALGDCVTWMREAIASTAPADLACGDGHALAERWLALAAGLQAATPGSPGTPGLPPRAMGESRSVK